MLDREVSSLAIAQLRAARRSRLTVLSTVADPNENAGSAPQDDDSLNASQSQTANHTDDDDSLNGWPQEARDEVRRLRAEARKHRLAARDASTRVREYEDRDKTEEQRRADELAQAARRAASAEQALLKYEVASEQGISQHAGRLQGDTREALVKDAQTLAREFGITQPGNGGARPDFSSGVRRSVQRPKTMNDVIRQAAGR